MPSAAQQKTNGKKPVRAGEAIGDGNIRLANSAHPGDVLADVLTGNGAMSDTPAAVLEGAINSAADDLAVLEFAFTNEDYTGEEARSVVARIRDRLIAALWLAERMDEDAAGAADEQVQS